MREAGATAPGSVRGGSLTPEAASPSGICAGSGRCQLGDIATSCVALRVRPAWLQRGHRPCRNLCVSASRQCARCTCIGSAPRASSLLRALESRACAPVVGLACSAGSVGTNRTRWSSQCRKLCTPGSMIDLGLLHRWPGASHAGSSRTPRPTGHPRCTGTRRTGAPPRARCRAARPGRP